MSRFAHAGCELLPLSAANADPFGFTLSSGVGLPAPDFAVKRSIGAAYNIDARSRFINSPTWTAVNQQWVYSSLWVYFNAATTASTTFWQFFSGGTISGSIRLRTDGKLEHTSIAGPLSAVIPIHKWVNLRFATFTDTSLNQRRVIGYLDTVQWLDFTVAAAGFYLNNFRIGDLQGNGQMLGMRVDDIIINTGDGTNPTGFAALDESVLFLSPVADSAVGANWRGGAGGALTAGTYYQRVDQPVTAVVHSSATDVTQLRNAVSGVTNPAADIDVAVKSLNEAGVSSGATVITARAVSVFADNVTTRDSIGVSQGVSNPVIAGSNKTQAAGFASGAWGQTAWTWALSDLAISPTITVSTRPIVRFGKRIANTDQLHLALMGLDVTYGPAPSYVGQRFKAVA